MIWPKPQNKTQTKNDINQIDKVNEKLNSVVSHKEEYILEVVPQDGNKLPNIIPTQKAIPNVTTAII